MLKSPFTEPSPVTGRSLITPADSTPGNVEIFCSTEARKLEVRSVAFATPASVASSGRTPGSFLENLIEVGFGNLKGGRQTEQHSGDYRNAEGKAQYPGI